MAQRISWSARTAARPGPPRQRVALTVRRNPPLGRLCVLSDGMVIEYFDDPTTAVFYGWKLGADNLADGRAIAQGGYAPDARGAPG